MSDSETEKQIQPELDAKIEAEEKARQEAARRKAESSEDDLDKRIRKHVGNLYNEIEGGRFVDCPGCGDKILKRNGTCKRCGTKYDVKSGKWVKDTPDISPRKSGIPWLR
jgi:predicted RNA-binding Zn-ribbon protein involved in translation (DUF1610 family)